MPSVIEIVIRGTDRSGPAFASAQQNLARLTQGSAPAVTGLARVENQATETGSAIITLGIAGSTTATRMRSLNVSIVNQQQALRLAEQRLHEVRAAHDADSLAVGRAQLAYDRLNRSLLNNRARMADLRTSGDVSGISVVGVGGGAAAGGLMGPGGLQTAAAGLGLALGAREMVQFGTAAIGAANDLEKVDASIRALAGSQEAYTEVLALARHNQDQYGGTTEETLRAFRGLIPLTRSANIALADLDKTTRLLTAYQPEAGPESAVIALREFLTGTGAEASQSLQMRFELDKERLNAIVAGTDDATERTRLLNQLLAEQGINEELLTAQAQTRAAAYDRMASSVDRMKVAIGAAMGDTLLPYVQAFTGALEILTGNVTGGMATLRQAAPGIVQAGAQPYGYQAMTATMGERGGTTIVNNYTVQGSLVTEKQIAETTRKNTTLTARRNGGMTSR